MRNLTRSTSVHFSPIGFVPTDEQRKIQASQSRTSLIIANAGAAKTTTLALRIGEALSRGMAPEEILGLTFTNEAKEVLQARVMEIGVSYKTARRIQIQTIEEFSQRVLSRVEDIEPRKIQSTREQRTYAISALETVIRNNPDREDQLEIRTHNTAVSQFLRNLLRLKATMALVGAEDDADPEYVAERIAVPLTDYLWAIEYERKRIDLFETVQFRGFFDATYDLACCLRTRPEASNFLPTHKLVVCDELHDINEASFCIIETLLSIQKTYFVGVGDTDQVIYSNLGADDSFLRYRFSSKFPDCVTFPLTMTYRHGPHLAYAMEAFKRKPVDSTLPLRTDICEATYPAVSGACGEKVVTAIRQWEESGKPLEQCCILLRDRHQSIEIENSLMQANIPYRTLTMNSYLHRDEILFLRGMLAIALGDLQNVVSAELREAIVEALATFGEVSLTREELDEAKSTIAKSPSTISYFFEGQIKRTGSATARARIENAVSYLRDLAHDTPGHIALENICKIIDMEKLAQRLYIHPYEASVITKSVAGFIATARTLAMTLRDFSEWLGAAEASAEKPASKGMVFLECAAYAKGREFEHVVLPFLDNGEFPNSLCELEEEENLFYVAATRAKSRLTLIASDQPNRRSVFISRMQLHGTQRRADDSLRRNFLIPVHKPSRRDLKVAYENKDVVKTLGAQWDKVRKVWYVPGDMDLEPFKNWLAEK